MRPTHWGVILITLLGLYFVTKGVDQAFNAIQTYVWIEGSRPKNFSMARYIASHLMAITGSEFFGLIFLTRAQSLSIRFFWFPRS